MTHASLFSGIGAAELAAASLGWENVFNCEIQPWCRQILKFYWPEAQQHHDVTTTDFSVYRGRIDVLTGGFPCQPYSSAGKRKGKDDDRHLWPHMLRAIREIQPTFVVGENVRGLLSWNDGLVFDEIHSDLEAAGYEVLPFLLPAAGVNAPHQRYRIFFVANSSVSRREDWKPSEKRKNTTEDSRGMDFGSERPSHMSDAAHTAISDEHGTGKRKRGSQVKTGGLSIQQVASNTSSKRGRENTESGLDASWQLLQEREGEEDSVITECACQSQTTTDSTHLDDGRHISEPERRQELESGELSVPTNATDTNSSGGIQGDGDGISRLFDQDDSGNYWESFPTQSPICGGDDGLPTELDGITFSKWRRESISAYGNAIVPQLLHRIFTTLEQHDSNT